MARDHIPQELIDIIVDDLIRALKCCSLAARTFVRPSRPHIFRKLEILPPTSDESRESSTCQKLYKLLTSSPHIAPLVEELYIVLVGSETSFAYDSNGQWLTEPRVTWIMAGRTLSLVLPLLDLKRISLVENAPVEWNSAGEFSMNWNGMGRMLKSALTDVFSSPRLESVYLRGFVVESPRQLLSLFSEAASLKTMSLSQLTTGQWSDSIIRGTSSVEHLRLWYWPTYPAINPFKCIFEVSANLRSLHFFTGSALQLIIALFTKCPHDTRIETIIIEGPTDVINVGDSLQPLDARIESSFVHFSALKKVEIRGYPRWSSFLSWSEAMRSLLPSLVHRGMLTVTEIQYPEDDAHHGWE
ncbi:hypothetical protein FB451DRAFT_1550524 [Mycena latifolia]|nr:hypothetical protein FB451DRAFT_1550524 [Mycena latifolia]